MSDQEEEQRTKHKRLHGHTKRLDDALVENCFLVPDGEHKTLAMVRSLASCIQTAREQYVSITESMACAARILMIDSVLEWIFEKELVLCIEGYKNREGNPYIKTKEDALIAMASMSKEKHDGMVYELSTFCEENDEKPYGEITIDTTKDLLSTFPACSDIMLNAVKDAEWLASDLNDFDDAVLRKKSKKVDNK